MMRRFFVPFLILLVLSGSVRAACCYFSAKDRDVDQPSQKAFITWEPDQKAETFTVQPKFAGNAVDFGMVVPTPSRPKLDEMPRDFFRHLAIWTVLLPVPQLIEDPLQEMVKTQKKKSTMRGGAANGHTKNGHGVTVLESGVVGSLDYKILEATDPEGLYRWLKANRYSYSGDEKTLGHYTAKKWIFTVMKIDAKQMKKGPDGTYQGEVTPTRFSFTSDTLVYPLRITQISVKEATEALFYVQAPQEMDLKDSWSWAWSYRIMWLTSGTVCLSQKQMTDAERAELEMRTSRLDKIRQEIPDFDTTKLDWAAPLSEKTLAVLDRPAELYGQAGFPDLPEDAKPVTLEVIRDDFRARWAKSDSAKNWPAGYLDRYLEGLARYDAARGALVARRSEGGKPEYYFLPARTAPADELAQLAQLKGHLKAGRFITKFRKKFLKHEMDLDLELVVPAGAPVIYQRLLPQSPP